MMLSTATMMSEPQRKKQKLEEQKIERDPPLALTSPCVNAMRLSTAATMPEPEHKKQKLIKNKEEQKIERDPPPVQTAHCVNATYCPRCMVLTEVSVIRGNVCLECYNLKAACTTRRAATGK